MASQLGKVRDVLIEVFNRADVQASLRQVAGTPQELQRLTQIVLTRVRDGLVQTYRWARTLDAFRESRRPGTTLGERIISAYRLANDERIWITTEADRSATRFPADGILGDKIPPTTMLTSGTSRKRRVLRNGG